MKKTKVFLGIVAIVVLAFTLAGCTQVSGGGWIDSSVEGKKITFGFDATPTEATGLLYRSATGEMQIVDHGTKYKLHGQFNGTWNGKDSNNSEFWGICDRDNIPGSGDEVEFTLSVYDNGLNGTDKADYITFYTSDGYYCEGTLQGGNITVGEAIE